MPMKHNDFTFAIVPLLFVVRSIDSHLRRARLSRLVRTLIVPNQAVATYITQWKYDSHNRLLEMIYPDEEKVTYGYNLGGQVEKVSGYKTTHYDYVSKIGYDKFEQRTYLKYCNGAETFYSYDPARRRLQNLVVNAKAGTIMDNAYSYDAVSNVLGIKNNAPLPQSGKAGGQMSHSYTYDPLYRLASATGTYAGSNSKTASYTLAMGYDNMHRITSKKQHLSQTGVQFDGTLNAGYDLTYTYNSDEGKKFQLGSVRDINYRTEEAPTDSTNINNGHKYEYDLNGNLVYINTSRVKHDGKEDEKATEQKYKWDEENRLLAADENGFVSNYWYDADGERTVKTSGENEAIFVNSEFSGGNTGTARFSLYVSPYLVAGQGGKYTKHIYIGSQRIVSKLGDLASYGADPRKIPYAGNEADGVTVNYKDKYNQQLQSIKENYKTFDLPYNGVNNSDYVNGKGFSSDDDTPEAAQARAMVKTRAGEAGTNERLQFYYHPDHLGSSSYITNLDGEVSQHIEYVPFGEVFIEERNNTWNTPYLFNAKELDEETGMYYYGARYYEPRLSLWMSCDPMQEKFPQVSSYCYTYNNPIIFKDILGLEPTDKEALAMANDAYKPGSNKLPGNWRRIVVKTKDPEFRTKDDNTGFMSALYGRYDKKTKSYSEYVYATAGTDLTSIKDWENNLTQLLGSSDQYQQSVHNAQFLATSNIVKGKELTFVGHSLGGGLASANSLATGKPAITFNSAALSPITKKALNLNQQAQITSYIVQGEILDYMQRRYLNIHAEGNIKYLPATYCPVTVPQHDKIRTLQRIKNHMISSLMKKIK